MSLLSFRSVCINVLLNSGIGAEFFMTCTFGIGMLYSDISLFTYVQIVVYFLNAAFQFYTSKGYDLCAGALALTLGGGPEVGVLRDCQCVYNRNKANLLIKMVMRPHRYLIT